MNTSLLTLTVLATAQLTANRFCTAGGALPTLKGNTLGVCRAGAAIGELSPVDVVGTTMVEASASISAGAALNATAAGLAVTHTDGVIVARALTGGGANELIEVLLIAN